MFKKLVGGGAEAQRLLASKLLGQYLLKETPGVGLGVAGQFLGGTGGPCLHSWHAPPA